MDDKVDDLNTTIELIEEMRKNYILVEIKGRQYDYIVRLRFAVYDIDDITSNAPTLQQAVRQCYKKWKSAAEPKER